ncbi:MULTISPECIES: FecR domain-containing protein [Pseudomonas]|uniref:FecR domain-containing protein n=1 Tax=Pseudomonas TaxID=286 RepID=UPI0018D9BB74|nr:MULTISPECIES: FecR domain-containing protein [Pseudomonas]MBH3460578.1 FecR domain-containing protein [Pseudomonas putida]MBK0060095.1 FecR domain-containing protein [Pseudomonas sp. S44]
MKAILADAVNWYVRLHDSDVDETTRVQWQAWYAADNRHAEAWARLEQLQYRLGNAPRGAAQTLQTARWDRRSAMKALALLLGVGAVGWQGYRVSPWRADYWTRVGERRQLTLADGTRLDLNTDSRVDVVFDAGQRLIQLRQGEILVDTAQDPRPLSVCTAEGDILALGARFSVRQDAGVSHVTVATQAVEVQAKRMSQRLRIDTGYSLSFTADSFGPLRPMEPDAQAWVQGMLVSVDWRLGDVVQALARYRPGYLGCSKEVAGLRLSGAFNLDDTNVALASLEDALPIRVRRMTDYWVRLEPSGLG